MNSFYIYVFSFLLAGNIINTSGSKIHLLSHIEKNGDTVKLDDTILEELAVDSNMVLKTKSPNKILYYAIRKFLSIILTYSDAELNDFIDIFLGQMTYKVKFESVEQFKSKLNIMAERSGFGVKYVFLTWWIYLNDDEELQLQIDTLNTIMMLDPFLTDTYLDSLKLYKIKGKDMIDYDTAGFLKLITTSDDTEMNDMFKKISGNIYNHLVVYDDTAEKVFKKPLFKVSKHILTDFLYELVKILIDFENNKLLQFFEMLDIEFRNYKYQGGKFETVFMTKAREDAFKNFISSFGSDYFTIQQSVKRLKSDMENVLAEKRPFLKIVSILDKTYNITHQEKLDNLLIQVRRYATSDIGIGKIFKEVLRLILFDHVDNVNKDIKNMISNIDVPSTNMIRQQSDRGSTQTSGKSIQLKAMSTTTESFEKKLKSLKKKYKKKKEEAKRKQRKIKHNKKRLQKQKLKSKKKKKERKVSKKEHRNKEYKSKELGDKKEPMNNEIESTKKTVHKSKKSQEKVAAPQQQNNEKTEVKQKPLPERTGADAVVMVEV